MWLRKKFFIVTFSVFIILLVFVFFGSNKHSTNHEPLNKRSRYVVDSQDQTTSSSHPPENLIAQENKMPIECKINEDVRKNIGLPNLHQRIKCLANLNSKEAYIPFSFVKKYFDIYGQLNLSPPSLTLSHSYSKVFPHLSRNTYDPGGSFLQFASFDVENRPRVKCVSAQNGVPITTQWDKEGYFYATQICQYALAHWSKAFNQQMDQKRPPKKFRKKNEMARQEEKDILWIENGNDTLNGAEWSGATITRVIRDRCVHFDQPVSLSFNPTLLQGLSVISFDLLIREAPVVELEVYAVDHGTYRLLYSPTAKDAISKVGKSITFNYGSSSAPFPEGTWKNFTRNIHNDIIKGLALTSSTGAFKKSQWLVKKMSLSGVGCITNIAFAKTRHLKMFYDTADWLVESQNQQSGAWHVEVPFNLKRSKYPFAEEMAPGWISAMGSAHAMSVLTRAFRESGKERYLRSAVKAIAPFSLSTEKGGVRSTFMKSFTWYEEYPTRPSSFVLNGFMYSLLGLYDLWQTLLEVKTEVKDDDAFPFEKDLVITESLFRDGLSSLVALLPLFDTGSGSTYDLRHFTMGGAPKLARWDYHSTHINLMFVLSTIASDDSTKSVLKETANRWQRYMVGERAEHN